MLRNVAPISAGSTPGLAYVESYGITLSTDGGNNRSTVRNASDGDQFSNPVENIGSKTFGPPPAYESYARSFTNNINVPGCHTIGRVCVGQRLDRGGYTNEELSLQTGRALGTAKSWIKRALKALRECVDELS